MPSSLLPLESSSSSALGAASVATTASVVEEHLAMEEDEDSITTLIPSTTETEVEEIPQQFSDNEEVGLVVGCVDSSSRGGGRLGCYPLGEQHSTTTTNGGGGGGASTTSAQKYSALLFSTDANQTSPPPAAQPAVEEADKQQQQADAGKWGDLEKEDEADTTTSSHLHHQTTTAAPSICSSPSPSSAPSSVVVDPRCLCVAHRHATSLQQFRWEWRTIDYHMCYPALNHRDWRQLLGESYFPSVVSPVGLLVCRVIIALMNLGVLLYDAITYDEKNARDIQKGANPWVYLIYLTNWTWLLMCFHSFSIGIISIFAFLSWTKQPAAEEAASFSSVAMLSYAAAGEVEEGKRGGGGGPNLEDKQPTASCSAATSASASRASTSTSSSASALLSRWMPGYVHARERAHSLLNLVAPLVVPSFFRWRLFSCSKRCRWISTKLPPPASCPRCCCDITISPPHLQPSSSSHSKDTTAATTADVHFCCLFKQRSLARFYRTNTVLTSALGPPADNTLSDVGGGGGARGPSRPPPDGVTTPWFVRMSIVVNCLTVDVGIAVVLLYWCLLVPTQGGGLNDLLEYWKHLVGPLLIVFSAVLSRLPFPSVHLLYTMIFTAIYVLVTALVYVFQIQNMNGDIGYVYGMVDYGGQPVSSTVTVILTEFIFVPAVHLVFWFFLHRRNTYVAPPPAVCCCASTSRHNAKQQQQQRQQEKEQHHHQPTADEII
eukprot:GHVS01108463.1.p1 GENE.GHVS01108463.1~~GHVS01108463.1.p1  ORF type:complete len:718 (-),score=210.37 GHVS01108463.1:11-2164(-)